MDPLRPRLLVLALMLIGMQVAITGCATYRQAALPGEVAEGATQAPEATVVEGSRVRVKLRSGEIFEGTVRRLYEGKLQLGDLGNYGLTEMLIEFDDIDAIGVRKQGEGQIERSWFVGLFVALIVALAVSLPIMKE